MSYSTIQKEHLRLAILLLLAKDSGYDLNEHLMRDLLTPFGHQVSRDLLRVELAWLAEQGLVKTDILEETWVAKLNSRGLEVAEGRAVVPGIKRPGPDGY